MLYIHLGGGGEDLKWEPKGIILEMAKVDLTREPDPKDQNMTLL